MAAAGFLSRYLNGPLPYVWRHITVNKMCWVCREIKHFLDYSDVIWVNCSEHCSTALENLHLDDLVPYVVQFGLRHDLIYRTCIIKRETKILKTQLVSYVFNDWYLNATLSAVTGIQTLSPRNTYNLKNVNDIWSIKCEMLEQFWLQLSTCGTI